MSELHQAIDKQNAEFEKHFMANDMENLKKLYTEDCRLMAPGQDTQIGREFIAPTFGEIIKAGGTSLSLVADEVGPLGPVGTGDTVFERGHYTFSKPDGSAVAVGKHVVIWKKTSEGYKLTSSTTTKTVVDRAPPRELHEAIDKRVAEYVKLFMANDIENLKKMYTEDCRIMPPGQDTKIGRESIGMGEVFKAGGTSLSLVADEVGPLGPVGTGDMVFERGHYTFSKSDGSAFAAGKHVVIWKKTSEGYKMYLDIFNAK